LGVAALASLFGEGASAKDGLPGLPHFAPKAKRAIYLHMVGGPRSSTSTTTSGDEGLVRQGPARVDPAGPAADHHDFGQSRFPIAPSVFKFAQRGQSGAWVSDLLPYTAKMVDDMSIIKTMNTEAINHEPAITFIQTGAMIAGKPCMGAWMAYGLGR